MKKGIIFAACFMLAAALAGCELHAAIPAFLLPSGSGRPSAEASATPVPQLVEAAEITQPPETAAPTATPAATPSAESEPYPVLQRFESTVPEDLTVSLAYTQYATPMNYFAALRSGWVYAKPDAKSKKLRSFTLGVRLGLDKMVQGVDGKSRWYHVSWTDGKGAHEGYAKESAGRGRSFRLGLMLERARQLKDATDSAATVYVVNYKNRHGLPPALPGSPKEDPAGNRRDQSAPAYAAPDMGSSFRYAPDGMLGTKLEKQGGFTNVFFPAFGEARWVPDKYLSTEKDAISNLTQVVVVDRAYQNSAAFEYADGRWKLISMTFVSTGKSSGYSVRTPLGDFMAQGRYKYFYYYKDGTKDLEGYAPYAVRFSAGGYLHGVPRKFKFDASGKRIDPGLGESLRTLGTTPQSHMCVRNYTSYSKFIYDWFQKGSCAVIVLE